MFKKLRIKFIAITMVMVAIVMALAFSVVCIVEYQRSLSVVQTALSDAAHQAMNDNQNFRHLDGQKEFLPPLDESGNVSESGSAASSETVSSGVSTADTASGQETSKSSETLGADQASSSSTKSDQALQGRQRYWMQEQAGIGTASEAETGFVPPEIGNRHNQPRSANSLIPVAVYRYDAAGEATLVPQVTTAAISDDLLADAVAFAQGATQEFGTINDLELHYFKMEHEGTTYLAFADTSYTDSWQTLALMLAVVGLATLVVFFVISLFYSQWALRPVREAWDSQRQFVADASHDLKTPLTVVLANSAILLKHPERSIASESQWIESTQKEAETMQGLVNEMLELAQIEAGEKVQVAKEQLEFSDLVEGETLMFDAVALERNCTFDCEIAPGITVYGNDKQIEKLVSTLIENAFKYVDEGGSVDITLRQAGKNAVLAIRNTGSVISKEDLPHIFDRFYRTDKARTSGEGGFGLGLAIAREIARQHGGDIICASSESEGTLFTVTLPA